MSELGIYRFNFVYLFKLKFMENYKIIKFLLGVLLSLLPFVMLSGIIAYFLEIKDERAFQGLAFICIALWFLVVDKIYYKLTKLDNIITKKFKKY